MDIKTAEQIAYGLMEDNGLIEKGWCFGFDNAKKRLGQCNYTHKRITMSRYMVGAADEEQVRQIMLHEIAHAMLPTHRANGTSVGHGPEWKRLAAQLGYTGKRTATNPYQQKMRGLSGSPDPVSRIAPEIPSHLHQRIRERDIIRLRNGIEGPVTKIGRTRYHIAGNDGQSWNAPFASVTKIADREPFNATARSSARMVAATSTPTAERSTRTATLLTVGQTGKLSGGGRQFKGLTVEIIRVGRTRYLIQLPNGDQRFAPFALVATL